MLPAIGSMCSVESWRGSFGVFTHVNVGYLQNGIDIDMCLFNTTTCTFHQDKWCGNAKPKCLISAINSRVSTKKTSQHCLCTNAMSLLHYSDVIMSVMASEITSFSIVYSTVCSDADQRKHQSSMLLAFVRGIHWWPVNSLHKGPVTRKMFPFDDVIMGAPICIHKETFAFSVAKSVLQHM